MLLSLCRLHYNFYLFIKHYKIVLYENLTFLQKKLQVF